MSYDTKYTQHNRRTGVMVRTEQSLLLTSECNKLDVRAELDTEAFDGARDSQKAEGYRLQTSRGTRVHADKGGT